MPLKLPKNAESAFRIQWHCAFGSRFNINLYGANNHGWFVASFRHRLGDRDTGPTSLLNDEWPELLSLIDRCGFWALPEDGSHLIDPTMETCDGDYLIIEGRDATRYHRVPRSEWREPGLDEILAFGYRVCGWFSYRAGFGWVTNTPNTEHLKNN